MTVILILKKVVLLIKEMLHVQFIWGRNLEQRTKIVASVLKTLKLPPRFRLRLLKEDPVRYLSLYFKKFISFIFIDLTASYKNYYSPMHIIPKMLLAITSFIGIILAFNLRLSMTNYVILFYYIVNP